MSVGNGQQQQRRITSRGDTNNKHKLAQCSTSRRPFVNRRHQQQKQQQHFPPVPSLSFSQGPPVACYCGPWTTSQAMPSPDLKIINFWIKKKKKKKKERLGVLKEKIALKASTFKYTAALLLLSLCLCNFKGFSLKDRTGRLLFSTTVSLWISLFKRK